MAQEVLAAGDAAEAWKAAKRRNWREAVRIGTEANRRRRDPTLEMALARWRCLAFSGGRGSERPDAAFPAPAFPDLGPPGDGVPECQAGDLTPERVAGAIAHKGSLLVRGLLSPEEAEQLRQGIDHAYAAREAHPEGDPEGWYCPLRMPGDEGSRSFIGETDSILTADSPRLLFELIERFTARGVIDLAAGVLGERPALSILKSTLRRTRPGRGGGWHQDGAFLGDVGALNVWLALTPCGRDAVGLDVVSRRIPYVVQTGTHGAPLDWMVGDGMLDVFEAGGVRIESPEFAAGDALLFDHLMLHRTALTPGATATRYAIETWMFTPSVFPMEQLPLAL